MAVDPASRPPRSGLMVRATALLPPVAGLLGGGGVMVSAAAAHLNGGSIATTGGTFLLIHAAAVLALAALARQAPGAGFAVAGVFLSVGCLLFSGDLALAGLWGWRPVPLAAPIGGTLLISGWLAVPISTLGAWLRRGRGGRVPDR